MKRSGFAPPTDEQIAKRRERARATADRRRKEQAGKPRRAKPIAPVGKRRRRTRYAEARRSCVAIVKARDVSCRAPLALARAFNPFGAFAFLLSCGGPLDVHEVVTRGRGGSATDPGNCILVCRHHHDWIHRNPIEATTLGLLASGHAAAGRAQPTASEE